MTTPPEKRDIDERLADIIEQFLGSGRDGKPPSKEQLLAEHPELADELEGCLQALDYLHGGAPSPEITPQRAAAGPSEPVSQVWGDYGIVREIGRGGMGIVFEAVQLSLGRRVALKVLPWATLLDRRQRERFRNEARVAARLHHSNIVPVFAVGSEQGIDYYAMQYIDGEPLDAWIEGRKAMPSGAATAQSSRQRPPCPLRDAPLADAVAALGVQAADALAYAHRLGVIHRDIKPSNLLVDGAGKLWVTDFGVARSQSQNGITATGDRVGTLRYMSPEQFARQPIDHRTDIYSLGVTLCELLASRPGRATSTPGEEYERAWERDLLPRDGAGHRLPRDLRTILAKAAAPDRAARYETAEDLVEDLRRFLRGEPVAAQRPWVVAIVVKWLLRHRELAAAGLLIVLLATIGLAVSTALVAAQRFEAERQRDQAEAAGRRAEQLAMAERRSAEQADRQRRHVEQLLSLHQVQQAVEELQQGNALGLEKLVKARQTAARNPTTAGDIESLWSRWHAALDGRLIHVLGHESSVSQVAFSPDGSLVATASDDATIKLWVAHSGRPRGPAMRHEYPVTVMCFSEEGDLLASGDAGGSVQIWSTADGRRMRPPWQHEGGAVRAVAFRPGHPTLATATGDSWTVRLWSLHADDAICELEHEAPVVDLIFVRQGEVLATAARNALHFWDVDRAELRFAPIRHDHSVIVMCASPDGARVVTGGPEGAARVWDVDSGREIAHVLRHPKMLLHMRFSPDGRWLATVSLDRALRCWETSTWQPQGEPLLHPKRVFALAFSPDSRVLATGCADGGVRRWDIDSGNLVAPPFWHRESVRGLAFDAAGARLATASDDATAGVWNTGSTTNGALLQDVAPIRTLVASPDGRWLVSGMSTGEVSCWELSTQELLWRRDVHQGIVTCVVFSPVGQRVATASEDCTVRFSDAATGRPLGPSLRFLEGVKEIAYLPGGEALVIGCNDKSVTLWDEELLERRELCRDSEAVKALAVDPGGKLIAFGTNGWFTHLLSLKATNRPIASLPHGDRIRRLCFNHTGSLLGVGGEDGVVRLWEVPSFVERGPALEQGGEVFALSFHPSRSLLAAAVRDATYVRLWDVGTSLPFDGVPLVRNARPLAAAFTPDGQWLATGWDDGGCWLWPVPPLPESLAAMQQATLFAIGARIQPEMGGATTP